MATNKYVISLEVDRTGAVQNIDKVSEQLDKAAGSASNLKGQLRQMQKQLADLDTNSAEFQKLSKEAGNLKDRINDAAVAVKANAGSSFETLGNNARNLKDSLLNLDFEQVGSSLKGLAGSISGVKFSDLTDGIKNVGKGFATLGKALLTNPLFLLVTGVTLLIANFDKLAGAIDGVTDAQVQAAEAAQASADASKAQFDHIGSIENSLRVQGKSEKEILELKKAQLDQAILLQRSAIEQQRTILETQIQAAERNKSIVVGILDFITAPITAILKSIDSIASVVGKELGLEKAFGNVKSSLAGQIFNPDEVRAEGQKAIDEATAKLEQLQNTRDGFTLQEQAKQKEAAKARQEERDKELAAIREQANKVFDIQQKLNEAIRKDQEKNSPLSKIIDENDAKFKAAKDQADLELQLSKDTAAKEIAAIDQKYIELRQKAGDNAALLKQLAIANAEEVAAVDKRVADEKIKNDQAVQDARLNIASSTISALRSVTEAFGAKSEAQAKRQFQINKGLQIAQALIQTYQSATGAYASQISIPSPDAPIRAAIAAGAAVAAGLAQVAKIKQTQFNSTGGGGGGSASVSVGGGGGGTGQAQGAPQFNPVNTDFVNNKPPQPTQAYVLAGNVVSGVEAREKVQSAARL